MEIRLQLGDDIAADLEGYDFDGGGLLDLQRRSDGYVLVVSENTIRDDRMARQIFREFLGVFSRFKASGQITVADDSAENLAQLEGLGVLQPASGSQSALGDGLGGNYTRPSYGTRLTPAYGDGVMTGGYYEELQSNIVSQDGWPDPVEVVQRYQIALQKAWLGELEYHAGAFARARAEFFGVTQTRTSNRGLQQMFAAIYLKYYNPVSGVRPPVSAASSKPAVVDKNPVVTAASDGSVGDATVAPAALSPVIFPTRAEINGFLVGYKKAEVADALIRRSIRALCAIVDLPGEVRVKILIYILGGGRNGNDRTLRKLYQGGNADEIIASRIPSTLRIAPKRAFTILDALQFMNEFGLLDCNTTIEDWQFVISNNLRTILEERGVNNLDSKSCRLFLRRLQLEGAFSRDKLILLVAEVQKYFPGVEFERFILFISKHSEITVGALRGVWRSLLARKQSGLPSDEELLRLCRNLPTAQPPASPEAVRPVAPTAQPPAPSEAARPVAPTAQPPASAEAARPVPSTAQPMVPAPRPASPEAARPVAPTPQPTASSPQSVSPEEVCPVFPTAQLTLTAPAQRPALLKVALQTPHVAVCSALPTAEVTLIGPASPNNMPAVTNTSFYDRVVAALSGLSKFFSRFWGSDSDGSAMIALPFLTELQKHPVSADDVMALLARLEDITTHGSTLEQGLHALAQMPDVNHTSLIVLVSVLSLPPGRGFSDSFSEVDWNAFTDKFFKLMSVCWEKASWKNVPRDVKAFGAQMGTGVGFGALFGVVTSFAIGVVEYSFDVSFPDYIKNIAQVPGMFASNYVSEIVALRWVPVEGAKPVTLKGSTTAFVRGAPGAYVGVQSGQYLASKVDHEAHPVVGAVADVALPMAGGVGGTITWNFLLQRAAAAGLAEGAGGVALVGAGFARAATPIGVATLVVQYGLPAAEEFWECAEHDEAVNRARTSTFVARALTPNLEKLGGSASWNHEKIFELIREYDLNHGGGIPALMLTRFGEISYNFMTVQQKFRKGLITGEVFAAWQDQIFAPFMEEMIAAGTFASVADRVFLATLTQMTLLDRMDPQVAKRIQDAVAKLPGGTELADELLLKLMGPQRVARAG